MKLWGLVWQQDLAKINVNLKLNEVENAKFYEIGAAKDFQGNDLMGWLNGRTTRDPAIFWSTQGNYRANQQNPRGFVNEDLEKLVAAGAVETDADKRKTHLPAAERAGDRPVARHPGRHQPAHLRVQEGDPGRQVDLNGNIFLDTPRRTANASVSSASLGARKVASVPARKCGPTLAQDADRRNCAGSMQPRDGPAAC